MKIRRCAVLKSIDKGSRKGTRSQKMGTRDAKGEQEVRCLADKKRNEKMVQYGKSFGMIIVQSRLSCWYK